VAELDNRRVKYLLLPLRGIIWTRETIRKFVYDIIRLPKGSGDLGVTKTFSAYSIRLYPRKGPCLGFRPGLLTRQFGISKATVYDLREGFYETASIIVPNAIVESIHLLV
jgi:hypothetical protein